MHSPKSSTCVLCGIRPATTHDHVPPKGLFKGLGAQLITVPACAQCNNGASSDDEDLRFYISAQVGKQAPGSVKLWDDGAHKSVKRKTALREQLKVSAHEVRTFDAQGNPVVRLAFLAPVRTYQSVFERTTRGLYFFHTGRVLPATTRVMVDMLASEPNFAMPELQALALHSIADDACRYRFGIDEADADSSLWLYAFYDAHWVMVRTGASIEGTP